MNLKHYTTLCNITIGTSIAEGDKKTGGVHRGLKESADHP